VQLLIKNIFTVGRKENLAGKKHSNMGRITLTDREGAVPSGENPFLGKKFRF
jgi:hypothetical protein